MSYMAGAVGHAPTTTIGITEKTKYEKMWSNPDYRKYSPGELAGMTFLQQAKPLKDSTCIDFGCGTGRGGLMCATFGQMVVTLMDFAENALDDDIAQIVKAQPDRFKWLQHDLTKEIPVKAAYGYCTDVMEHIPPEQVDLVLKNILQSANQVFFQISMEDDMFGASIGESLHLSVHPFEWWVKKFNYHGCSIDWFENNDDRTCMFYVKAWCPEEFVRYKGGVNTDLEKTLSNIRTNAKTPYQLVQPHEEQNTEVMLIAGGPSLNDYTDEIIQMRAEGMPMVTTNGTYNWAIANGMTPSMQLMIDARPFNKRFVTPVVDNCKYFLASQCDPSVFEDLPVDRTYAWHVGLESEIKETLDELHALWFSCPGGSTVTLRGLCLLRMLGFHNIHVYGLDSCYREESHHAYPQSENDNEEDLSYPVAVGGQVFTVDPWMYCQATEFMGLVSAFDDKMQLNIKGDGLIAHIIKTGAALSALETDEE